MRFSSKPLSQTVTQLCLAKEIDHVVISPGSRNAPLTIGFTENEYFNCYSIVDERCAAFFALGIAQQTGKPVALVCTSGSALLNYYPAIAEAYYSDIPLIVLSADRPAHLIDVGDGQTIRQENVYENHILYSANCKEGEAYQLYNEKEINIALNLAIEMKGPVHINLPFAEPLYEVLEDLTVRPQNVPPRLAGDALEFNMDHLVNCWNKAERKMILVGVMNPAEIGKEVWEEIARHPDVLVFTETTSNIHHPTHFPAIDQIIYGLNDIDFKALQPDLLITFGGMIVSKKVKAFLREYSPKHHWHINEKKAYDTFFSLTEHVKSRPNNFLKKLLQSVNKGGRSFRAHWDAVKQYRLEKHRIFEEDVQYSDFKVYGEIFRSMPHGINLQLANSAAVRYAQLFDLHNSLRVYCNRGTSGIDGSTSTAIGAAVKSAEQTVLVTGDLSFFYDSNALWNDHIPNNFRIILINNGGGGIFRILPGAKETQGFEKYFETQHQLTAEQICNMFGLEYYSSSDFDSLSKNLESFYTTSDRPALLEIFTPATLNDKVLMDYFEFTR